MKFTDYEPIAITVTVIYYNRQSNFACYFAIISVLTFIYLRSEYNIWLKLVGIAVEWLD